jgi:hypothetical protein
VGVAIFTVGIETVSGGAACVACCISRGSMRIVDISWMSSVWK